MRSVICTLLFFGYGLNDFAVQEYYQIDFVAIAIVQLLVGPICLWDFCFHPLEWVWRSLTNWKPKSILMWG
jgi:uncharacterized protein